jgi:hypothetical protein
LLLNYLQIGTPPTIQQTAQLGVGMWLVAYLCIHCLTIAQALTIILECAFHLWYQQPSNGCVTAAIAQYITSPNCHAVIQAVDTTFSSNGIDVLKDVDSIELFRDALQERLIQIAQDNRLCMSNSI